MFGYQQQQQSCCFTIAEIFMYISDGTDSMQLFISGSCVIVIPTKNSAWRHIGIRSQNLAASICDGHHHGGRGSATRSETSVPRTEHPM